MKYKFKLLLLLLILGIAGTLLFRQYGPQTSVEDSSVPEPTKVMAQSVVASSVASTNDSGSCLQLPLEISSGDFAPVNDVLECILVQYTEAANRKDRQKILALDKELQELELTLTSFRDDNRWETYWQSYELQRYTYLSVLGVSIDEKGLQYDGSLRFEYNIEVRRKKVVEFEQFKPQFDQILAAFRAVPKTSEIQNIKKLYSLDEQLEKFVAGIRRHSFGREYLSPYREIGVFDSAGTYYSGEIRLVADKLLPPQGFIDPKSGKRIKVVGDRYSELKQKLETAYLAYHSLERRPEDADALYEISEEISKLMDEIHKVYPNERSKIFWDKKYEDMGMYIGHYSDRFDYGGKLLIESYRLNPDSKYGEASLAATVSGAGGMSELSDIPDLKLAETYLRKYPNGKHIERIYGILATFYQNLFEELLDDDNSPAITMCYNAHLASHPEDKDKEVVRKKAIAYYMKLISISKADQAGYKKALSNLEKGIDGGARNWCTD